MKKKALYYLVVATAAASGTLSAVITHVVLKRFYP